MHLPDKPPNAPSAYGPVDRAHAVAETPTAAVRIRGSKFHGLERGATTLRNPHIPSIQRKSASFVRLQGHTPPSSLNFFSGRMGSLRLLRPSAATLALYRRNPVSASGLFVVVGPGRSMGDTSLNTPRLGQASAESSFELRAAFSPGESVAVIEPPPSPLSTKTFPHHAAATKDFADNALGVYCYSFAFRVSPNLRLHRNIQCCTLFVPNNMHYPLGCISLRTNDLPPHTPTVPPKTYHHPPANIWLLTSFVLSSEVSYASALLSVGHERVEPAVRRVSQMPGLAHPAGPSFTAANGPLLPGLLPARKRRFYRGSKR